MLTPGHQVRNIVIPCFHKMKGDSKEKLANLCHSALMGKVRHFIMSSIFLISNWGNITCDLNSLNRDVASECLRREQVKQAG